MYPIGSFAHTFSTLQKRPLLSKFTYGILTQAGPKNLAKIYFFLDLGPGGEGGMGWDGMGWNGIGCDMMGWDGIG